MTSFRGKAAQTRLPDAGPMRGPASARRSLSLGEAKLAGAVLLQRAQLAGRDLITLDGVRLGMESAHVVDEAPRDARGSSIGFRGMDRIEARGC